MNPSSTDASTVRQPLRLWPGVAAVVLQWLIWLGLPVVWPGAGAIPFLAGVALGLVVLLWWLFFSRAAWGERLGIFGLMVGAMFGTSFLLHESMATAGQGMLVYIYAIPVLCLALVLALVLGRRLANRPRLAIMVLAILLAAGSWTLLRTDGVSAEGSQFAWRWSPTAEERLLAQAEDELSTGAVAASIDSIAPAWPGFRGPGRDSIVAGIRIGTDWSASPPVEVWRRAVGPGWSSFAVQGDLIYTQEQRGEEELVACYRASTGEPVWRHSDAVRFWESNAGAGPRATPTLHEGRVYALGATGLLNVLDAGSGAVVWSRDAAQDTEKEPPTWGFSGSPLIYADTVVVALSGKLAAYDLATGDPRWFGPDGGTSYSSPHLLTLGSVEQILLLGSAGATSVAPVDGTMLWQHDWPGFSIVQPALTDDGDLLLSADQVGTLRLAVGHGPEGWTVEERWTSNRLKANFNDFVIHKGYAYGLDGNRLACMDTEKGERQWKGGRYGQGQLVLLADQDLLLLVSEKGELVVVDATPEKFNERAKFAAIEGKTWNHPVLVKDLLLTRNDQEMAAFRLPLTDA